MALAAARNTQQMLGNPEDLALPVKAATTCYQGGLAVIDAGYAAPGRTATGLIAAGRFESTVDNSTGANGALNAVVKQGVFKFANSGVDAVVAADLGKNCYIVDDSMVAHTDGGATRSVAGKVIQLDSDGVWVRIGVW